MRDPIVDDVRSIRDEIAREHNYDVKSIFRMLRQCELSGVPHVKLSRKRPKKQTIAEELLRDIREAEGQIFAGKGVSEKKAREVLLGRRKK